MRPNQAWKVLPVNGGIEAWFGLQELWQEACQLDLLFYKKQCPFGSEDPLWTFLTAASEGLILQTVREYREKPQSEQNHDSSVQFSCEKVLEFLSPTGILSRNIESYCYRPQQVLMAKEVSIALEQDEFLLAEAGTGVGKTLAYLAPSIY